MFAKAKCVPLSFLLAAKTNSEKSLMRQFCGALPVDRLLQGNNYDIETVLKRERPMRKYVDPSTGATLTYGSSLVVLANFLGCLVRYFPKTVAHTFSI